MKGAHREAVLALLYSYVSVVYGSRRLPCLEDL